MIRWPACHLVVGHLLAFPSLDNGDLDPWVQWVLWGQWDPWDQEVLVDQAGVLTLEVQEVLLEPGALVLLSHQE